MDVHSPQPSQPAPCGGAAAASPPSTAAAPGLSSSPSPLSLVSPLLEPFVSAAASSYPLVDAHSTRAAYFHAASGLFSATPARILDMPNGTSEAVCRICDRTVSAELLLAHSTHCRVVHSCAAVIEHNNEKLATIITSIERRMNRAFLERTSTPPTHASPMLPAHEEDDNACRTLIAVAQFVLNLSAEPTPTFSQTVSDIHRQLIALQTSADTFYGSMVLATLEALSDKSESIMKMNETLRQHVHLSLVPGEVKLPTIDDFEVHKTLSRGAFGEVFLARKKSTQDYFAVKVLKKRDLIRKNQIKHVMNERNMMAMINSPYVIQLFYSFQTLDSLYMVMEYATGGDVHMLLQSVGILTESWARFYMAEVVLALEHIHSLGIVHRDIKPDNLLITATGHIKLADFGLSRDGMAVSRIAPQAAGLLPSENGRMQQFQNVTQSNTLSSRRDLMVAKRAKSKTTLYSYVGTPDYIAPEVLMGVGHDTTLDWWTAGVCLYEFLVGLPPFFDETVFRTYENIRSKNIEWPDDISPESRDLIDKLLMLNPSERLGARGASEVKAHPFFRDVDWKNLVHTSPSYIPMGTAVSISSLPGAIHRTEDVDGSSLAERDLPTFESEKDSTTTDVRDGHEHDDNPDPDRFLPFHFKNLKLLEDVNKRLFEQATQALPTESIVDEDKPFTKQAPLAAMDFDTQSIRCLVAEDNPVTQLLVKALMKQIGINITQAYTGAEAVAQACSQKFNIIFMDIMMPEMEGTQATSIIRQSPQSQNQATPVIAFTALSDWNMNEYRKGGMNDLLAKPFTKGELYNCIKKWVKKPDTQEFSASASTSGASAASMSTAGSNFDMAMDMLQARASSLSLMEV